MKTSTILKNRTSSEIRVASRALRVLRRLVAGALGALLVMCASSNALAQTAGGSIFDEIEDFSTRQKIANMTTYLLTAPLTTAQSQALHAKNFNQLPASQRTLYLHAVAYDVGIMVASGGQTLSSAALAEYLKSASMSAWPDDWEMPWLMPALSAHKTIVKTAMQELNVMIATQVSNNAILQQAMETGAVNSFFDVFVGDE